MMKRVVIAGCRNYNNYEEAKKYIEHCLFELQKYHSVIVISGCSSGADALGEGYAIENGLKVEKYPAEWEKLGRRAGPVRNRKMAEICDMVICFWDGESTGTKSMINWANKLGKPVYIKKI